MDPEIIVTVRRRMGKKTSEELLDIYKRRPGTYSTEAFEAIRTSGKAGSDWKRIRSLSDRQVLRAIDRCGFLEERASGHAESQT